MVTIILIIHIILACCIICAVLVQKSDGGGLGIGGSGGAGGGFMTARGTANFMTKLTAFLGACFFLTSIVLALLSDTNNSSSIVKEVEKSIEKKSPNKPTVPLGN
jgi:preprotein translocase subunit SecG